MLRYTFAFGVVCALVGLPGIVCDDALLGYDMNWTAWFLGSAALMALGFCFRMRFTPAPDLMLRTAAARTPERGPPKLTLIQGGKSGPRHAAVTASSGALSRRPRLL